jgi:hypothetical protein
MTVKTTMPDAETVRLARPEPPVRAVSPVLPVPPV